MEKNNLLTAEYQKEIEEKAKSTIDEAIKTMESLDPPKPEDMFSFIYEKPTQRQARQLGDF